MPATVIKHTTMGRTATIRKRGILALLSSTPGTAGRTRMYSPAPCGRSRGPGSAPTPRAPAGVGTRSCAPTSTSQQTNVTVNARRRNLGAQALPRGREDHHRPCAQVRQGAPGLGRDRDWSCRIERPRQRNEACRAARRREGPRGGIGRRRGEVAVGPKLNGLACRAAEAVTGGRKTSPFRERRARRSPPGAREWQVRASPLRVRLARSGHGPAVCPLRYAEDSYDDAPWCMFRGVPVDESPLPRP